MKHFMVFLNVYCKEMYYGNIMKTVTTVYQLPHFKIR